MPATEPGPFELLRARCLIEAEICSLAAETRKDADLDRIFSALADMREFIDDKEKNEAATAWRSTKNSPRNIRTSALTCQ